METDQSTNQSPSSDSPDVAGCPAPICSGARAEAVRGYMAARLELTNRIITISLTPKNPEFEKIVKTITDEIERIDSRVNWICSRPDEPPKYTGHVQCRKCGQTHWMHGSCPQNTEGHRTGVSPFDAPPGSGCSDA